MFPPPRSQVDSLLNELYSDSEQLRIELAQASVSVAAQRAMVFSEVMNDEQEEEIVIPASK